VVILPYYGTLPAYFKIWISSCKRNPTVDFILVTDLQIPDELPSNVKVHFKSKRQLTAELGSLIGVEVNLQNPYKLCDFKPSYGHLFESLIKDYDYWGYGDLDVIYGDLDTLVVKNLGAHDVISFREKWMSGSLAILKNKPTVSKLYLLSKHLEKVFKTPECLSFDEVSNDWNLMANGVDPCSDGWSLDHFTGIVLRQTELGRISSHFEKKIKESIPKGDWIKVSDHGITDCSLKEYVLYHYITEKKTKVFGFPSWQTIPGRYHIDESGFYTEDQFSNSRARIRIQRKCRAVPKVVNYYVRRLGHKLKIRNES
jgi:hypothetical protein